MNKNNKILVKLGKKIFEYRKEKGFSQEELGFLIRSARNYVGCIERGEKSPSINTLCKIAKVLDVKVKDLIDF